MSNNKASKQEEGKVIRKKKAVTKVDAALFVSSGGVPKVYRQVAATKFPANNKDRLRMLMAIYSTWGRELCPLLDFNDFILKMEKFSGANLIRQMLDTMRRGEEWDAENFAPNTNTTKDTTDDTTTSDPDSNQPPPNFTATATPTLTEEQKERIARNKEAALAKQKQQASQQRTADEEVELEIEENNRTAATKQQRTADEEVELEIEEENSRAAATSTQGTTTKPTVNTFDDYITDDMLFDVVL